MAAAPEVQLFTRGGPGEADNRGESLVQRHLNLQQEEKENAALEKLAAVMPQMGSMVRAMALAKADWDVEAALGILRQFQVANLDQLNALSKKRKKLQETLEADLGGGAGEEASLSESESDSGSDSDRNRKSNKKKSSKHSKHSKKHKKTKDSRKHKKEKEKKKRRKGESDSEEEAPAGRKNLGRSEDYGRYGVLREADVAAKRNEFLLWATDEKKVNMELLAQWEEKELLAEYMEDYNTGTLPHKKYYDLEGYARQKALKAAEKGEKTKPKKAKGITDEEELRQQKMMQRQKEAEERLKEAYAELKHSGKAADMRQQELLRAEMALAYKTGDKARAQRLFDRLAPDEKK